MDSEGKLKGVVLWTGLDLEQGRDAGPIEGWTDAEWEKHSKEFERRHQSEAQQCFGWKDMITKLNISDGDLVLVKYQGRLPDEGDVELVREALRRTGRAASALFVPADWGLHTISKERAERMLHRITQGQAPREAQDGFNAKKA